MDAAVITDLKKLPINVSGLCQFLYVPVDEVAQFPEVDPVNNTALSPVVLKAGRNWRTLKGIDKGQALSIAPKSDTGGDYIESAATAFHPDSDVLSESQFFKLKQFDYLLMLKERNGMIRIIGNEYAGAQFSYDYTSGEASSQRGHNLSFNWQSIFPPLIYNPYPAPETQIDPAMDKYTKSLNFTPIDGQQEYNNDLLNGRTIVDIFIGPFHAYLNPNPDGYQFRDADDNFYTDNHTCLGKIHFNNPLTPDAEVQINYI